MKFRSLKFKDINFFPMIIAFVRGIKLIIDKDADFKVIWPLVAFIGLDWPFWPLLALNEFSRPKEVFLGKNKGQMTTFHYSDVKNSF